MKIYGDKKRVLEIVLQLSNKVNDMEVVVQAYSSKLILKSWAPRSVTIYPSLKQSDDPDKWEGSIMFVPICADLTIYDVNGDIENAITYPIRESTDFSILDEIKDTREQEELC